LQPALKGHFAFIETPLRLKPVGAAFVGTAEAVPFHGASGQHSDASFGGRGVPEYPAMAAAYRVAAK
jgi:hypothetical protein